jgi:hypothetical protein
MIVDMKRKVSVLASKLVLGVFATLYSQIALAAAASDVQGFLRLTLLFINNVIIPLLFSIALLFFLVNAARYFIIGGSDSDNQKKAKTMALYGIGAFVFLVSIWGIVNMLVVGLGFRDTRARCPDYLGNWCESRGYGGSRGGNGINVDFQIDLNARIQ